MRTIIILFFLGCCSFLQVPLSCGRMELVKEYYIKNNTDEEILIDGIKTVSYYQEEFANKLPLGHSMHLYNYDYCCDTSDSIPYLNRLDIYKITYNTNNTAKAKKNFCMKSEWTLTHHEEFYERYTLIVDSTDF